MKSPFKFLSPFQQEDIDSFFGREQETDKLYEFVNLNRVVLVYGQSGTGKTSLIQCGLANYFKSTDWKPFFIRRGHNINATLLEVISDPGTEPVEAAVYQETEVYLPLITQKIEALKAKYLRPVYLIFDQFEELLILGSEKEKEIFIETLKAILHGEGKLSCNIIIVMREEYFAWLDVFEKEIPGISDRRLRVEKMRPVELREVIRRSTALFNIRLEDEEKNTEQILQALSKRKEVPLPYLQVYLDQLWRKDFAKSYPQGYTGKETYPPLTFTTKEIEEFGEIKDVLQQLIIECEEQIMHGLKEMNITVENNFVRRLLDVFASEEGTKLTVPYSLENGQYRFRVPAKALNSMPGKAVEYTLHKLEKSNILKNDGHSFELAHDSLAKLIDRQRDAKQKWLNGIRMVIENAYKVYEQTNELLSAELVKEYESHLNQLNLKDKEKKFFLKSQEAAKKEEYSELIRSRRRKNMKIITLALAVLLIALFTAAVRLVNAGDKYYALVYAAYNLDSIKNNNSALQLGKYIYEYRDGDVYDSLTKDRLEKKILKLASKPDFQREFSYFNLTLPSSRGLEPGDVSISESGRYMFIKGLDPETGDTMHILIDIHSREPIDTFKGLLYAYFIQHTDTLLLAKTISSEPIAASYPNRYSFHDCHKNDNRDIFLSPPGNNLLYSKENIFDPYYSDRDNYKVRMLNNGNILFPIITNDGRGKLYVMKGKQSREYNSIYSVSNSTDGRSYMLADSRGYMPVIMAYNQDGGLEWKKEDIYMADFTEKGSIIYISADSLHLYSNNASGVRSYKLQPKISYAMADGDESVAIVRSNQDSTFFLANLSTGKILQFKGELVGHNFQTRNFITRSVEKSLDKITLLDFNGDSVQTYVCKEGIKSQLYNAATSQLYVLTNAHNFIVLDRRLQQKASFYLTPNDTYGCSADGSLFYYVRDDNLCVFRNTGSFINLHDYKAIFEWLDTSRSNKILSEPLPALLEKHDLEFPSQQYFFWY